MNRVLLAGLVLVTLVGCSRGRGGGGGGGGGFGGDDDDATSGVCERWNDDTADLSEGSWSGSVAGCEVGDISERGRANALRMLNLMRYLADLTEVETDPERDRKAQAAALIFTAEGRLSHYPDQSWQCWSPDGEEAAGSSNISSAPGVASVLGYMIDRGNETTLGHRRWILSNRLGPVGLGSTDRASAMWVLGGATGDDAEWTAWPPPGDFPIQANADTWSSMDDEGWSVQSDSIELAGARVVVTDDTGTDRPVTVWNLEPGYGASSAISIIPSGWGARAGTTYSVSVEAGGTEIAYDVRFVDCG